MVTALIVGKPVSRTGSGSTSAKEKEKDDGNRERTAAAAASEKPSSSSNNNEHDLKRAQCQQQNNSSSTNNGRLQYVGEFSTSTSNQINLFGLPPRPQNVSTATATATAPGQKIQKQQGQESIPLMPHHQSTSWPPLTNDKAMGSWLNSNGEKFPENAAAVPTKSKVEHKMSEEEKWIKTFNDLKEYRDVHGRVPVASDDVKINFAKWMAQQRDQYEKHLAGRESTLSETRLDLLRSIGLCNQIASNGESKRRCMFWGCKRELGANESFHCAEHRNIYTSNIAMGHNLNNPSSTYNIGKPSATRYKSNAGELSTNPTANVTQHMLKHPPEETSNRTYNISKASAKRYKSNAGELTTNPTANGTAQHMMKSPPEETSNRTYNISKASTKRYKSNAGELITNPTANSITQHMMKSPPGETSNREDDDVVEIVKKAAVSVAKKEPSAKGYKSNDGGRELTTNPTATANGTQHVLKSPPEEISNREGEDVIVKIVKLAADAVAKEVRYLGLQSSTDHVESAIKRFAVEVYCPLLYSSKEQSKGASPHSADRVLLSTFLALRDMLLINAEKFFPFAGLKDSCTQKESGDEANLKLTRDFASAVVQNAVKRLQRMSPDVFVKHIIPNQDRVFDQYLEASRSYDSKGEDFQIALGRLDATATYLNAKGSKLSARESIMARTSFNYAREQHPLIREDNSSIGQNEAHVAPNACVVFVMGESENVKKKDIPYASVNVDARHVERKEARESRIRLLKRRYNEL